MSFFLLFWVSCYWDKIHLQKYLEGKRVCLAHSFSFTVGKSRRQELKAASHILRQELKEKEEILASWAQLVFFPLYTVKDLLPREWCHPQLAGLPTSIKITTIIPEICPWPTWSKHSLFETLFQVILDCIKLTIKTDLQTSPYSFL